MFTFPDDFESRKQKAVELTLQSLKQRQQDQKQAPVSLRYHNNDSDDDDDSDDDGFELGMIISTAVTTAQEETKEDEVFLEQLADKPELILGFYSTIPGFDFTEEWCICPFGQKAKPKNDTPCNSCKRLTPHALLDHLRATDLVRCSKHSLFLSYLQNLFLEDSNRANSGFIHKDFYCVGTPKYRALQSEHEGRNLG